MKQNAIILGLLLALFTGCQPQRTEQYSIKFNIEGWESGVVYLEEKGEKGWAKFDTIDISTTTAENDFYTLTGSVETPRFCRLVNSSRNRANVSFFIENSPIQITGSTTNSQVSGSKTNDEYAAYQTKENAHNDKLKAVYETYKTAETEEEKKAISKKMDALQDAGQKIKTDYITSHPKSFVSPYLVVSFYYGLSIEEIKNYLQGFDKSLRLTPSSRFLTARIEKLKVVAIGQTAPDFTMNSPEDSAVKFSDIYKQNKYTLIDFWASWCGPCRRENPNVVSAYNKFSSKGFSVFGVSLDSNKAAWEKAIEADNLTWPHVSDLKGWSNSAAQTYAVNSIPANFLVDQNGKIVGANLTEESLHKKLDELLK